MVLPPLIMQYSLCCRLYGGSSLSRRNAGSSAARKHSPHEHDHRNGRHMRHLFGKPRPEGPFVITAPFFPFNTPRDAVRGGASPQKSASRGNRHPPKRSISGYLSIQKPGTIDLLRGGGRQAGPTVLQLSGVETSSVAGQLVLLVVLRLLDELCDNLVLGEESAVHALLHARGLGMREHLEVDEAVGPLVGRRVQDGAQLGALTTHVLGQLGKKVWVGARLVAQTVKHVLQDHAARRRLGRLCMPRVYATGLCDGCMRRVRRRRL
eukprot:275524-Pleurochrysis_carterae.AAC.1